LDLFSGGFVEIDTTDPTCSNSPASFTPSSKLSLFDGTSGNIVNFVPPDTGGWNGTLHMKESTSVLSGTHEMQIVSLDASTKEFVVHLIFSTCSQ
jgi:hypothetical protein